MKIFRGFHHPGIADACALTIGNFDGVHRGHQAMLALLNSEAAHRGVESCVLTFEPHPRDYFAGAHNKPELAPARIGTLRDKLTELARCGVQQTVVLPFDARLAAQSPDAFIDEVLVRGLGARYVLVGDDFRFGRQRAGDYAMLDTAGQAQGFDVARMNSYEVHGLRVSSSAVRQALAAGDMEAAARLLGRPYTISGHVVHGRKLGRALGATKGQATAFAPSTCDSRTGSPPPAASLRCWCMAWPMARCRGWPTWACARRWTRTTSTAAACCSKPIACTGPPNWVPKGRTVKSCAWNCCTNCTTS